MREGVRYRVCIALQSPTKTHRSSPMSTLNIAYFASYGLISTCSNRCTYSRLPHGDEGVHGDKHGVRHVSDSLGLTRVDQTIIVNTFHKILVEFMISRQKNVFKKGFFVPCPIIGKLKARNFGTYFSTTDVLLTITTCIP